MFKIPFFGKSVSDAPVKATSEESEDSSEEENTKEDNKKNTESSSASADVLRLSTEIDKLKGSVEGFAEVRASMTERLTGLSEQIGELRAMILDRDRTIQELELKAIKAADLVETVQPEKLMIEVQKEDAKFEALKANLEGNESIMERILEEVRELRKKLEFFRGIEEMIKLSDEVKSELVEVKKTEASIHINADKVETIYSELRKKQKDVDMFRDEVEEFKLKLDLHGKDIEVANTKMSNLADKAEVERLTAKLEKYIESLKEMNKSSSLTRDVTTLKKLLYEIK